MERTNFHTHSTFCDGKASPEAMVQAGLEAGLSTLGFSSHSMYPFSSDWHMAVEDHQAYCQEVRRLQVQRHRPCHQLPAGFQGTDHKLRLLPRLLPPVTISVNRYLDAV